MPRILPFTRLPSLALFALILCPSIFAAHAVTMYVPGVIAGNLAQYHVLYDSCQSTDPSDCQSIGNSLNETQYAALQVVSISGATVTLQLIAVYKNGTGSHLGADVNVDTGASNVTSFNGSLQNYFVLATGLVGLTKDRIWNSQSSPTLNTTMPEMIVGQMRTINFLNVSSSFNIIGYGFSSLNGYAYDQSTGLLVEFSTSFTTMTPTSHTTQKFAIAMVDNNIWGTAVLPDFSLSPDPQTVSTMGGTPGTSTISLARSAGFSATVKLSATASSASIICTLSTTSLEMGGPDTSILSCSGSPGTYTVIVDGNSGYSIHSASVAVNIASVPDFQVTSSGPISFQTGGSGQATITVIAQNGYGSTTNLAVSITPAGLTCNLSGSSLSGGGSVTLTCSGQPGSYTVTVKATGGGTSHSVPTSVMVSSATVSTQPASPLTIPLIAGGAVAVLVVLLVALLLRRRANAPALASGNATLIDASRSKQRFRAG